MSANKCHPMLDEAETIVHYGKAYVLYEEANNSLWLIQQRKDDFKAMFEREEKNTERLVKEIDEIRSICLRQARFLAMHGSDDHKSKNEAMLKVIANLLHIDYAFEDGGSGMDEIPF